jgi:hypothetical protein
MQVPPLQAGENAATGRLVGPVKVELAGVVKSTWNFQMFSELVPKLTSHSAGGAELLAEGSTKAEKLRHQRRRVEESGRRSGSFRGGAALSQVRCSTKRRRSTSLRVTRL